MHVVQQNSSTRFSANSEANASELLEMFEEIFPRPYLAYHGHIMNAS